VCVKLLLSCYHGGYLWLDRCITVDLTLIHRITRLSMQGPDPQDFYPGKATDRALAQKIKDTYGDVEKGNVRLQGSFHPEWRSVPGLPADRRKYRKKEQTYTGHRIRC
jgi:hypothetical protein